MRTLRVKEIISKLNEILTGYFHYYGITDNSERITAFRYNVMKSLFYWLNRRSQKKSYNWVEFLINVNDSFRKEPDAGKPQVRILRGAYDRKGCVYSTHEIPMYFQL